MKRLFALCVAAGVLLAAIPSAKAQASTASYGAVTIANAVSNAATASVTNGLIYVGKQKTVGVQITQTTGSAGGLGAAHMSYLFFRSANGTTLDNNPQIVSSPAQTGLSFTFSTNIDSAGLGYLYFISTNTVAGTGVVVTATYGAKIGTAQ